MHSIVASDLKMIENYINIGAFAGKTVVITGASGIIGGYLAATFALAQDRGVGPDMVTCVSRSGLYPLSLPSRSNFVQMTRDLSCPDKMENLPKADIIIHGAGYGQPSKFLSDEFNTLTLNTAATLRLCHKVNRGGTFFFLSTAEVYSGNDSQSHSEEMIGDTGPLHPRAAYIEGKRAGEAITNAAARKFGLRGISARIALVYGPGFKPGDGRVMNEFIEHGLRDRTIQLQDAGLAIRTYCYVSDAICMLWIMLAQGTLPVYNVGGIARTTIADLALLVGEKTDAEVLFPHRGNALIGAPTEVSLNLGRIRDLCPDLQFVSLEEGVERTLQWTSDSIVDGNDLIE